MRLVLLFLTVRAQSDQVVDFISTKLTSKSQVMDLELDGSAADLAAPPIPRAAPTVSAHDSLAIRLRFLFHALSIHFPVTILGIVHPPVVIRPHLAQYSPNSIK